MKFQIAPETLEPPERNDYHRRIFVRTIPRPDHIHWATITAKTGEAGTKSAIEYGIKYCQRRYNYMKITDASRCIFVLTRSSFIVTGPFVVSQRTSASSSGATMMPFLEFSFDSIRKFEFLRGIDERMCVPVTVYQERWKLIFGPAEMVRRGHQAQKI